MKLNCLFFCILLAGCINSGLAGAPKMEVEIVNHSARSLENAVVRFGSNDCRWGSVGKSASYLFYPHPITPEAELHWDEDGKHRMEKLDLKKIYPKGKSGRLTFIVHDGRVEVTFREKS